jgi:novel plant SNARE
MTADQIIAAGARTQDKSMQSIARSKAILARTEQIGLTTATTLAGQTDQLRRIDSDLDRIESNLALASKQIAQFVRRMATDKIILIGVACLAAIFLFVVLWAIFFPDQVLPFLTNGSGTGSGSTTA